MLLTTKRPLALTLLSVAVAGWLMDLAHPDTNWWPLALLSLGMMLAAARGLSIPASLLTGALAGFSFYGIHIWWLTVYLGLIPWIALVLAQTVLYALGFVLLTLSWRWVGAWWRRPVGRLGFLPVVLAAVWTIREVVAAEWPFGGFNWGRLAHSQSETPLTDWVGWLGTSGFGFVMAWLSALAVVLLVEWRLDGVARASVMAGALTFALVWPAYPATITDSIRVLGVQGNADAGLFADYERGDNLRDHYEVTAELFGEDVDVVIWPENASDIDPLRNEDARAVVDEVTREMGAPLVVGAITRDGDLTYNSVLLWEETSPGLTEATDQYDKIHPVPFAEYLPAREFFYPLAPDLFDLVPRDYSFGQRDTVFTIDGHTAGIAICYDIVDNEIFWQMMDEGADIIFAPTNNADFGRTDQSEQQLAIARLRGVEMGRSVVNVSTVGTSAIMTPTGETIDRLPTYTEGYMIADVPTASHTTPAVVIGHSLEWFIAGLGLAALVIGGLFMRGSPSWQRHDPFDR